MTRNEFLHTLYALLKHVARCIYYAISPHRPESKWETVYPKQRYATYCYKHKIINPCALCKNTNVKQTTSGLNE